MVSKEPLIPPSLVISVFLKIMPFSEGQVKSSFLTISDQADSLSITNPAHRSAESKETFNFERVFYPDVSQDEVYSEFETSITDRLFRGSSVGIFAFGQEGSGKSYTVFGEKNLAAEINGANIQDKNDRRGIMMRACRSILKKMNEMKDTTVELKAQFYQIKQTSIHELMQFDTLENLKSIFHESHQK